MGGHLTRKGNDVAGAAVMVFSEIYIPCCFDNSYLL
jgi:hypothetical protein